MDNGEETEDVDFEALDAEQSFNQLWKWQWEGDAPSPEIVKSLALKAWEYLGHHLPNDEGLLSLGEMCRYALCPEPLSGWGLMGVEAQINWQVWRDELEADGLAELFFPKDEKEIERQRFTFDFCQHIYINRGLHLGRGSMRDWFSNKLEHREDGKVGTPPPLEFGRPPECVAKLHQAIETCYECLRLAVVEGVIHTERMNNAVDAIAPACEELQILLARVHMPMFAGPFCQAIQDSFYLGFGDVHDTPEFVLEGLQEWLNGTAPDHYDDLWDWKHISRIGIPYFRKAVGLMAEFWPFVDPYDDVYAPAKLAAALTGKTLVELNRLSGPNGSIRSKRPTTNRRTIHLGDLAKLMWEENDHL